MPRHKWVSEADKADREDRDRLRDLDDVKDLFEDAELRRRVAELIVRSARGQSSISDNETAACRNWRSQ